MISAIKTWYSDILAYFRFVIARRVDRRVILLSPLSAIITVLVLTTLTVLALLKWADPLLLAWIGRPEYQVPRVFQIITRFGQLEWVLIVPGIMLIIMSMFNASRLKGRKNLLWHRKFLYVYFTFTGVAFAGLIGLALKNLIGRARPAFTDLSDIWLSMPLRDSYQFASFPSGHATTGGAIAIALALLFPRWRWLFIAAGIAVAISRPALGVHFPSDVVAGFVLGGGFIWFYARLFARTRLLFALDTNGALKLRPYSRSKKTTSDEK